MRGRPRVGKPNKPFQDNGLERSKACAVHPGILWSAGERRVDRFSALSRRRAVSFSSTRLSAVFAPVMHGLFADTEGRENLPEELVRAQVSRDLAERLLANAEFLGNKLGADPGQEVVAGCIQ